MKTSYLVARELKKFILTPKFRETNFVCSSCLREQPGINRVTANSICVTCAQARRREKYRLSKTPQECSVCHVTSTNFLGDRKICRDCRNKDVVKRKKRFLNNLGEKLVIMWKAGTPYDQAIEYIRSGNKEK